MLDAHRFRRKSSGIETMPAGALQFSLVQRMARTRILAGTLGRACRGRWLRLLAGPIIRCHADHPLPGYNVTSVPQVAPLGSKILPAAMQVARLRPATCRRSVGSPSAGANRNLVCSPPLRAPEPAPASFSRARCRNGPPAPRPRCRPPHRGARSRRRAGAGRRWHSTGNRAHSMARRAHTSG